MESLGATLPPKSENEPKMEKPMNEEPPKMEEEPEPESEESDVELDMEGVVEADTDPDQAMGDATKEVSEEDSDKFDSKRSEAMGAYSEGEWDKAIGLFTEAIEINANSAMPFVKRAACYLKKSKPNACIRDCNRAIEINPDNAAAHKYRGRAFRLLGKFLEAAKDLRLACKIDFDDQADEWLREVTPNVSDLFIALYKMGECITFSWAYLGPLCCVSSFYIESSALAVRKQLPSPFCSEDSLGNRYMWIANWEIRLKDEDRKRSCRHRGRVNHIEICWSW